jgi:hypothetical protein
MKIHEDMSVFWFVRFKICHAKSKRLTRCAFIVIELPVVIAIIAILVATTGN